MTAPFVSHAASWLTAARPRTLSLSMTPVAVGAALAWATQREVRWPALLAALVGSALIQVGTNLHNDAADSERGGDGPDRLGPPRVTASGLLSAHAVKSGAAASFAIAALIGLYLVSVGGRPILILGLLSILSGWAYTGGPRPIAYTPLGEVFVIFFFGLGAVAGTYWLCTAQLGAAPIEGGLAVGLFAAAVLLVNNRRDVEADARVGRRTLPIVAGPTATAWIYAGLMATPFALLALIARDLPHGRVWPALVALPPALVLIYRFAREPPGRGFNRILVRTVQLQFLFGLLLCIGLML
ncbi:MAG TPA: 1,4-dihydroxy-2-naphthoate octaprenyltransferase [Xanthobacteraceae bacterium]|nr:1,4-dihydroxy-2-naphthoate octaprenyltransferase [Xanthobacteraceae bacterium]